jgi:NarL family two-component system sensor histidine kinase LiaS
VRPREADETHSGDQLEGFRLRTALELHDGVLQTLTGAALQIAVARKLLRSQPDRADEVLERLGSSVSAEQQELRLYVDELKGASSEWTDDSRGFAQRVATLLDRVGAIWEIEVASESSGDLALNPALSRQLVRMVQEATVNSARHSRASRVNVHIQANESRIILTISDDGHGFTFLGSYSDADLREQRLGPLSLKHRVWDAEGQIGINSTTEGSVVRIEVPVTSKTGRQEDGA